MPKLFQYKGPWKGLNFSMPENEIDPAEFMQADNFILRSGELRSAPRLSPFINLANRTNEGILGVCAFLDANNVFHSCAISNYSLYQLGLSPKGNNWLKIGDLPVVGGTVPVQSLVFTNQMYFVNGTPNLLMWDGMVNGVTTQVVGYGAIFIAELADSILLINTIEQNTYTSNTLQSFPKRIRWSPAGVTTTFDPAINVGAGFNDLLEVPDAISNFFAIGSMGYILRTNGISTMSPTGQGQNPFTFDHLWSSKKGIGNIYPFAAAQYGSTGIIVSTEQIYTLSISNFNAIGKPIMNNFNVDAANATGVIIGTILPTFSQYYRYPIYICMIPQYPNTVCYMYSIEDQSWVRRIIKNWIPLTSPEFIYNS